MLYLGCKIGYWRGDIKGLVDDIGENDAPPLPLSSLLGYALHSLIPKASTFLSIALCYPCHTSMCLQCNRLPD